MTQFTLPSLPFNYIDLEPYIDTQTMYLHHKMHHNTYVTKLNEGLQSHHLESSDIYTALASTIPIIRNNSGGHYNHCFFWNMLCKPGSSNSVPTGTLKQQIESEFGSCDEFKKKFKDAALSVFGSGWAWLGVEKDSGKLAITTTANQDSPLVEGRSAISLIPVLGLDVWEHAYYLKYNNRRPEYIEQFWNVCNWDKVCEFYEDYASKGKPAKVL